jgi:hypothetical protein
MVPLFRSIHLKNFEWVENFASLQVAVRPTATRVLVVAACHLQRLTSEFKIVMLSSEVGSKAPRCVRDRRSSGNISLDAHVSLML